MTEKEVETIPELDKLLEREHKQLVKVKARCPVCGLIMEAGFVSFDETGNIAVYSLVCGNEDNCDFVASVGYNRAGKKWSIIDMGHEGQEPDACAL